MEADQIIQWLEIALQVVGLAAGVSALTPTPKDDKILKKIIRIVDVVALNVGNARNRER